MLILKILVHGNQSIDNLAVKENSSQVSKYKKVSCVSFSIGSATSDAEALSALERDMKFWADRRVSALAHYKDQEEKSN